MRALATGSDIEVDDIFQDMELINDLEAGTLADADAGLPELYGQVVIMNRLLGVIIAFIILRVVFDAMKFTLRLIQDNITNQI